jgi:hypothetical protein
MEKQARWGLGRPALHFLDGARLYVGSHDGEILTVESRQRPFLQEVFSRALQAATARAIDRATGTVRTQVAEVPADVIDYLWATVPVFEFRAARPAPNDPRVSVAFGPREMGYWAIGQQDFQPRGHLLYDRPSGAWIIRYH